MQKILEDLREKIKASDVDYLDIRLEKYNGTSFSIKKDEVEDISETDILGYGIRALHNGVWGFVASNDIKKIDGKIEEAVAFAKIGGTGQTHFASTEIYEDHVTSEMETDPNEIKLEKKVDLFLKYYKIISNFDKKIQDSSTVSYVDSTLTKYFLNSKGSFIQQDFKRVHSGVTVIAREGNNIQRAFGTKRSLQDYNVVYELEKEIHKVCQRALNLLKADSVKGGNYTVITDQDLTGVFAHEAFGHLSEADYVYKDENMKKIMKLGRTFGSKELNIVDNPTFEEGYGSYKYDDDGVKTKKNYLIKDGKLVGRLHSRETAGLMDEMPTGNSRAINYNYRPIIRMSNTCIENGGSTFDEMIKDIKLGIYAVNAFGGQTNTDNFVFDSAYGYMIRDGHVAELIRGVKLTGNVFETLKNIEKIGNDFKPHAGGCGKGGQSPLPVGTGGPHLRIKNVIVGGK